MKVLSIFLHTLLILLSSLSFILTASQVYASGRVADCPSGYSNMGMVCSRAAHSYENKSKVANCPSGYRNMGATCYKPPFDSKGMGSMSCSKGWFKSGARCYKYCRSGYTSTGETCFRGVSTLTSSRMTCRSNEVLNKEIGRCYLPQRPGQKCWADAPCGKGFKCQPLVHKCLPKNIPLSSNQMCSAFKVDDLSKAARNAGVTMSYGGGTVTVAGAAYSQEVGAVYGQRGEFGCYVSVCAGGASDISIANFATLGLFNDWDSFSGYSFVTSQGVSAPFVEAGFTTAQSISQSGQLLGSLNSVTIGAGVMPAQVGMMSCYTHVVDGNKGISQIRAAVSSSKSKAKSALNSSPSVSTARTAQPVRPPPRVDPRNDSNNVVTSGFIRIQNRWKSNEFLNVEHGSLNSGNIKSGWHSARWIIQRVPNTPYVRLQNYWKRNEYIHNQRGRVESGAIQPGWWSAQWTIEKIPGTPYSRVKNRWKTNEFLNNQRGVIQSGSIQPGWWSAMWVIR